jgi:hypothetical protein
MAKPRHQEPSPTSSRNTLAILAAGALLVVGLIAWALTRTVEKPSTPSVAGFSPSTSAPATAAAPATTDAATTSTLAPSAAPTAINGDRTAVKRIAAEDAREKLKAGNVTIIDVRAASAYAAGHIPGSLNIPLSSIESNMDLIPKGREIITYCT